MKTLYMIGGPMGVGKTTVCQQLKKDLRNSVFLDGDWCWDASPFQVTDETKKMVVDNICYLLNNFLRCSAYENIIFCWVMDEQTIIDSIVERLDLNSCKVNSISLVASEDTLRERLSDDVRRGVRTADVTERSISRLPRFQALDAVKIDTDSKTVDMIVGEIINQPKGAHFD